MSISFLNKLVYVRISFFWLLCFYLPASIVSATEAPWVGSDLKGVPCDGERMGYGPYDYTNSSHRATKLNIVEEYHFTKEMEAAAGENIRMGGQIGYTLRAFPNHHRALYAIIRHQLRFGEQVYLEGRTPAECYFQRAAAFSPRDTKVYQLYAYYLTKKGQDAMAIKQYEMALLVKPQGHLHYQLGKAYFKTKQYDDAVKHAKLAIERGFKKRDLKKQLQSVGKWPTQ